MKLFLILFFLFISANGAKILFFFNLSTYSHRLVVWELIEELSRRGHEITFLSPYPPKSPNPQIQEIHPKNLTDYMNAQFAHSNLIKLRFEDGYREKWYSFTKLNLESCKVILDDPEIHSWVERSSYDLVVMNYMCNDCALGFAYKFKAPFIGFDTASIFPWTYDILGFLPESSWLPDLQLHFEPPLSFMDRLKNTIHPLYWYFHRQWSMFPELEKLFRDKLNAPQMPPLRDLEREVKLLFYNNHFSTEWAQSLPPNVIPVGGIHIKDFNAQNISRNIGVIRPLPEIVQDFIQDSDFFYISFGSAVKPSHLSAQAQEIFFKVLGSFPNLKIIWKWEKGVSPSIKGQIPSNVKLISDWLPQQAILGHPRLKGFMTHGGLGSIQEAIFYEVPLVSVPIFAEQDYNAEKIQRGGYGIRLEVRELTEVKLKDAINSVVNDPKYKEKMLHFSKLFKDRPIKPVDLAIYWIEYVLRNKDVDQMRSPAAGQYWWERRLLDVYAFLFAILICILVILFKVLKIFVRLIYGPSLKVKRE